MPTETLSAGRSYTLTQNIVYALPVVTVIVDSNVALETSNTTAFTTNGTIAANTPTQVAAMFVRSTAGAALVSVKRY